MTAAKLVVTVHTGSITYCFDVRTRILMTSQTILDSVHIHYRHDYLVQERPEAR